jgi:Peptidase family M41
LRQVRDDEIREIAEDSYRGAYRLLSDHRDLLDEIAERLLANEVIEREEIQQLMRGVEGEPVEALLDEDEELDVAGRAAEAIASEPPPDPDR